MGKTAADYLCERLIQWGMDTVYGFPVTAQRDLGALGRCQDRLRFIQTRHEDMASFMARRPRVRPRALFAELSRQLPAVQIEGAWREPSPRTVR